jgi:hypothetical protein
LRASQLEADKPKLLLVGIVERACVKTIVREIPGIKDCFAGKDEGKGVSVRPPSLPTVPGD